MHKTIQLSLLSVALLSQLHANETVQLAPLSITSTAIATDELKSTDAVEVYTAKDIEKAHVQNIYEFLNKETSVFATSAYGNPFLQKIDMRGYGVGDGYQNIVVTINGRKMNNVDMVPQLLSSISPSSIQKIEIIKSSGIVTGGDGANAGVINITTKQSNDKEVSFYLGNYGLADGSFYFGHSDDTLSINASGEAQKSDGIRDIDAAGNKDQNKFSTGSFNLAYTPVEELELRLGANFTRTDVIYAGPISKAKYDKDPTQAGFYSVHQKYNSNVLTAGVTYYINDNLSLNVDTSKENKKSQYLGAFPFSALYDYKSINTNLDYTSKNVAIKAGIDSFNGGVDIKNVALKKSNKAAFLMSEFYVNDFTFKAGYRYEEIEYKSNHDKNKKDNLHGAELGVNYLINKEQSIFANYSHSYESSSLDRLFSFFTGSFMGYVDPSQANNYTIGYNNIQKNNKFKISAYYVDLKDEIYLDTSSGAYNNTNIDKSHKYGLDFYDKYILNNNFNAMINYNYVQAIVDHEKADNGTIYHNTKLPGVSNHNIKATLNYLPNKYATLALTQVWRSEAYAAEDFNNNFAQKQDAYNSTDISATYAKDNWEVFAKINNLFNQKNGLWIKDDSIYPVNFTTTAFAGFKLKF